MQGNNSKNYDEKQCDDKFTDKTLHSFTFTIHMTTLYTYTVLYCTELLYRVFCY